MSDAEYHICYTMSDWSLPVAFICMQYLLWEPSQQQQPYDAQHICVHSCVHSVQKPQPQHHLESTQLALLPLEKKKEERNGTTIQT